MGLLLSCFGTTLAQPVDITQAPPTFVFPNWKEVDAGEETIEYSLSFPSAVSTSYEENNTVHLKVFMPADAKGPIPVVLVLHYWGASDLRPERALAQELNRRGIAAALITLPYHLERTPKGRRSGDMAIEPDPERLKLTTLQSVWDTRRALDFLTSRPEFDPGRIGISGTSLGALIASLTFGIDSRVASATFLLGGADFAHILWNSSRVVQQRELLRRRGFTEAKLREALAPIEPLTYLKKRDGGTSFVVGARYDTVVPQQSTQNLIDALENPKVLWLDTGHYGGIFVQRRLMREVAAFFGSQFGGDAYTPPMRLYAPTFRVGLKADAPTGFDVAIGIDVLRFDRRGEGFASFLVTPRGPGLFIGRKITPVLSLGFTLRPKTGAIGIFWSTVL